MRAYWYDGAFAPNHPAAAAQQRYLEVIGLVPGIQLRLGDIVERKPPYKARIRDAVAAQELGVDPNRMLAEFD